MSLKLRHRLRYKFHCCSACDQLDKGLTIDCKKTLVDQRDKLQNEIDSFDKWAEAQSDIDTSIQLEVDKALGK